MTAIQAVENKREISSSWMIWSDCSELEEVSKDNLSDYYWKQWHNYQPLRNDDRYFWQMSFKCNCFGLITPESKSIHLATRSFIKTFLWPWWAGDNMCFEDHRSLYYPGHMIYNFGDMYNFVYVVDPGHFLRQACLMPKKGAHQYESFTSWRPPNVHQG